MQPMRGRKLIATMKRNCRLSGEEIRIVQDGNLIVLTIVVRCIALLIVIVGRCAVVVIVGTGILTGKDRTDVDALKCKINSSL